MATINIYRPTYLSIGGLYGGLLVLDVGQDLCLCGLLNHVHVALVAGARQLVLDSPHSNFSGHFPAQPPQLTVADVNF